MIQTWYRAIPNLFAGFCKWSLALISWGARCVTVLFLLSVTYLSRQLRSLVLGVVEFTTHVGKFIAGIHLTPPPPHCPPEDDFFSLPPYNKCCCPAVFRRSMRWSRAVISTSLPQRWSSWFYQRMGWDPGILKISEIHRALIRGLAKKNMMIWKSTGWDWLWLEWSQMDSNVAFVTLASFKVLESASDARTWSKGSWPWLTTSNSHRAQVVIL